MVSHVTQPRQLNDEDSPVSTPTFPSEAGPEVKIGSPADATAGAQAPMSPAPTKALLPWMAITSVFLFATYSALTGILLPIQV